MPRLDATAVWSVARGMQARAGSVALLFKAQVLVAAAYPAFSIEAAVALCNSVQADALDDRCGGPRARRGVAAAKRTLSALLCHSVGRSAVRERARKGHGGATMIRD